MSLESDFKEIRRVSTPWCAVRTTDYQSTIKTLLACTNGEQPPAMLWTCNDGAQPINDCPAINVDGDPLLMQYGSTALLAAALRQCRAVLPNGSIIFVLVPDNDFLGNPFTVQAISDLRDSFKSTGRTLVILGVDPRLSPFLAEDVPILDDPLPSETELAGIAVTLINCYESIAGAKKIANHAKQSQQAASMCLGMTRFAAEEAMGRKLRGSTGFDFSGLKTIQRNTIEQSSNRALMFERQNVKFNDMGGGDSFKQLLQDIMDGPRAYSLVVRVDEIEKTAAAATGGGDAGVSDDIRRGLLIALEDNRWPAVLSVGPAGTGKTLSSICAGNEFDVPTLAFDLGAVKDKLVGESEAKMRRNLDILLRIGGQKILWIATANNISLLSPELQARFGLGTWFWDLPEQTDRPKIWQIQMKRYAIPPQKLPNDDGWVCRDIARCCEMAQMRGRTLMEASRMITVSGVVNKSKIETLRAQAEQDGWLSASLPGPYKRAAKSTTRKLNIG